MAMDGIKTVLEGMGADAGDLVRVLLLGALAQQQPTLWILDDLHFERRGYSAWPAYGQSKLANLLFTLELQKRLKDAGSEILVTAAHPGWTMTELQRHNGLAGFKEQFKELLIVRR